MKEGHPGDGVPFFYCVLLRGDMECVYSAT